MNSTFRNTIGYRKDLSSDVASWLNPVQWQLFATLEFTWNIKPETANIKFRELINSLERTLRTRICFVNSLENRSKSGVIIFPHYHAAFTAAKIIPCQLVASLWNFVIGRSPSESGDLVLVEPFDPAKNGIAFIAKQITDESCEWDFRNIDLFNGSSQPAQKTDHATQRSARRLKAQVDASPIC